MTLQKVSLSISNRDFTFETGHLAKQAHGAIRVQCGGTVVLATVVSAKEPKEGIDFFPLTVDYREKAYAAGKFPGGYFKREGRPTEKEILTSRLMDRPIRSAFNKEYKNETQIMATVLSFDGENDGDILAMNGAFAALLISDVPFTEPLAAVRVGLIEESFAINPTLQERGNSDLDLIVAGTLDKIVMIEAGANEVSEEKMMEALKFGHAAIQKLCASQNELRESSGKAKRAILKNEIPKDIYEQVKTVTIPGFEKISALKTAEERDASAKELYEEVLAAFDPKAENFNESVIKTVFHKMEKDHIREMILGKGSRPDGRGFRDIRDITCELQILPRVHGSSLFTRGQTQSLSAVTLGTSRDEQRIDALEGDITKQFILHYNFPPFSVGEVGRFLGTGRREIGHGALAERALKPVLPSEDEFPYVIRLVSEILESNGSSSMATVCGGTLALMDAGVPIKAPVAGIALGLITDEDRWKVLTDIAGVEDFLGDMDFKAAGTRKGLTALQMDLKICGVTDEILLEAFNQAKEARFKILDILNNAIDCPRTSLSEHAPRITVLQINPEKIGALIGPGGKVIRGLSEETGAKIDVDDTGRVMVASVDAHALETALKKIREIVAEVEIGKIYEGRVQKLMAFGAFIEVLPGQDGLCHVSEVSESFAKNVADYLRVGDMVPVKVVGLENGKISLSIKQAKEGGMPILPPDVERDVITPSAKRRRPGR